MVYKYLQQGNIMARVLTNPQDLKLQDLRNYDWDILKLNITFDTEPLLQFFRDLETINAGSHWIYNRPDMKELYREEVFTSPHADGIDFNNGGYWTLQWPIQRTDPLPVPFFCNRKKFPELLEDDWESKMNNHLEHYYYGAYKSFVEQIGQDAWTWGRAMSAGKEHGIGPHMDDDDSGYMIRLHVNVQADEGATWHFFSKLGESPRTTWPYVDKEREYHPKSGEIILVNVSNIHSLVNHGDLEWKLLHSDPSNDAIERLLKSSYHISL